MNREFDKSRAVDFLIKYLKEEREVYRRILHNNLNDNEPDWAIDLFVQKMFDLNNAIGYLNYLWRDGE